MFKCKVCVEKDKRIKDCQDQIDYLKALIYNPNNASTIPYVNIEANKLLESSHELIDATASNANEDWLIKEKEEGERLRIQNEALNYLNGTY